MSDSKGQPANPSLESRNQKLPLGGRDSSLGICEGFSPKLPKSIFYLIIAEGYFCLWFSYQVFGIMFHFWVLLKSILALYHSFNHLDRILQLIESQSGCFLAQWDFGATEGPQKLTMDGCLSILWLDGVMIQIVQHVQRRKPGWVKDGKAIPRPQTTKPGMAEGKGW